MRVALIYLGRRGPGGPISLALGHHLSKKTDIFAVVSTQADHYLSWQKSGIDLVPVSTFSSDSRAAISLLSQGKIKALAAKIVQKRPDVVVYSMVHPWTPFLHRYMRVPLVVTVHDAIAHPGFKHFASSLWESISARRAARCVVMSPRFVETMMARGVAAENIDIIPLGIFSFYGQQQTERTVSGNAMKSILFFGRITEYKGLEVLLTAFEIIARRRKDIRLDVVGAGDLKPYARQLKNMSNVRVVNRWVDDSEIASFFQEAAMAVLPYTTASQSGVIPLAASFRVPVVATTVGALPDQIRTGETGLLVSPNSVQQLVEAIDLLLDRPDLAARLGDSLSRNIEEVGNWDRIADSYLESCRKALGA